MACRGFLECILKLLNFLMTLAGLAMVGYGIYLFIEYKQSSSLNSVSMMPPSSKEDLIQLGRPFLALVTMSSSIWDDISSAWYRFFSASMCLVSVFLQVIEYGLYALLLLLELFFLSSLVLVVLEHQYRMVAVLVVYALLLMLLILVELGCAAFMFFDHNWELEIPTDNTGYFHKIFGFLKEHWSILKWVALGIVVFEAALFFLAILVRAANTAAEYDSDEEFISPRQSVRHPLINRAPVAAGVPFAGAVDQRASRNDAWSARMREKYGLNTSELTYNPNDQGRYQQAPQRNEEGGRCTIM